MNRAIVSVQHFHDDDDEDDDVGGGVVGGHHEQKLMQTSPVTVRPDVKLLIQQARGNFKQRSILLLYES